MTVCRSCHQWHFGVFAQYGQLLHSKESSSHQRTVHVGEADGPGLTGKRRRQMKVERSIRVYCRWFERLHAGHARELKGVSPAASRPHGDETLVRQRPNKPHGMTRAQYRTYPKQFVMRQVAVDARDKNNRVKQFKVVTTILDTSIDGNKIGDLFERRWGG